MMIKNKNKSMSENRLEISSLFTCVYVGLAEEQRQTLYSFKWAEVVNTLMKAVHAVLVLKTQIKHT